MFKLLVLLGRKPFIYWVFADFVVSISSSGTTFDGDWYYFGYYF